MNLFKYFLLKYKFILIIFIAILYHALIMRMMPWTITNFTCILNVNGIKSYQVPREIKLRIYGLGFGQFTNDQYYEKRSFMINTKGSEYASINQKLFGGHYTFETPVKRSDWGTHMFAMDANDIKVKGKSIGYRRTLILTDYESDREPDPNAFWSCS
jgi:hypothetical protein